MSKGWRNESHRHSLSARGIKTSPRKKFVSNGLEVFRNDEPVEIEDSPWADYPYEYIKPNVGDEFWFEYHCFESEESCDAELWHHTHQKAKVIKVYTPEETDMPLFDVEFPDGFRYIVHVDELKHSPEEFELSDYKGGRVDE